MIADYTVSCVIKHSAFPGDNGTRTELDDVQGNIEKQLVNPNKFFKS